MNKQLTYAAGIAIALTPLAGFAEEAPRNFTVAALTTSDPTLTLDDTTNCATALKELARYAQYRVISSTTIQGPPGVVYTLQGPGGEVALLKCGLGHEPGGCSGEE